jgi:ABC-type arginine/histidine transport system permease subunit
MTFPQRVLGGGVSAKSPGEKKARRVAGMGAGESVQVILPSAGIVSSESFQFKP